MQNKNRYEGCTKDFLESRKRLFEEAMAKSKKYPLIMGLIWGMLVGLVTFTINQTLGLVLGISLFSITYWGKKRLFWKLFFYKHAKGLQDGEITNEVYAIPSLFELYEPAFSLGYVNPFRMFARQAAKKNSGIGNPQTRAEREWEEINQLLSEM
ncbi:hypothetical protein [Hungatella hominis]|uniref:Uncharacterized protein n=1 Tax=Hungatella hominis TaxID=2763050 RepID=A0ABR7H483_9FIRM|nr:hypothetical protein [Hungatella hominis]MBC5707963.1 hypothetical protein [Hungatella hominis]